MSKSEIVMVSGDKWAGAHRWLLARDYIQLPYPYSSVKITREQSRERMVNLITAWESVVDGFASEKFTLDLKRFGVDNTDDILLFKLTFG